MKLQRTCVVCGAPFTADRITQKYCSPSCRRYAHRRGLNVHQTAKRGRHVVFRAFRCLKCGMLVEVIDPKDKRIKFCSAHCERLYWKHSRSSHRITPGAVQRTFTCRYCGTTVTVTKAKDKRTAFCSEACRMRWFSLHRKR